MVPPSRSSSIGSHGHARGQSPGSSSARHASYAPAIPSGLRESHRPPPTPGVPTPLQNTDAEQPQIDYFFPREPSPEILRAPGHGDDGEYGPTDEREPNSHSRLLEDHPDAAHDADPSLNYGSFGTTSPVDSEAHYPHSITDDVEHTQRAPGITFTDRLLGRGNMVRRNTKDWFTKPRSGMRLFRHMDYYLPFLKWSRQLTWSFVLGDLVAALTMASFYIPMSLSYASNLGHIPPINGLYSFVFNPLIYAFLGTCPQMVVGPEAAGSLLTGNVVRDSISKGRVHDGDGFLQARVAGVVTGVAGAILLIAGVARLGFLDNVLSRPFLRGFISAIGFVILVDQTIPEMGLNHLASAAEGVEHGSALTKAIFIFKNMHSAHGLTCAVSFGSLAIIMVCREVKKRLQKRYPGIAYVPDRFTIVVVATILTWKLRWDLQGLEILGDVRSSSGTPFPARFPFDFSNIKHLESALSTSFVISLLGFFESSVAAKSLGAGPADGIQDMMLSANRELVALGTANIIGGVFMALPAFGGYGRSKVNSSTGGRTPMSSIFLSLITLFCVVFLLPAFHYIPKGVLSAMVSVVAYSLIEEAPHDIHFFWRIGGWSELFLIAIVFLATVFYSLPLGIACGIGFSLLRVIKHSVRPRIQILGRVAGTAAQFENAETADPEQRIEFVDGCLIIKIPEPLTFANTGDLRSRLVRLEKYASSSYAPQRARRLSMSVPAAADDALSRTRTAQSGSSGAAPARQKTIIFDVHGVTSLDGAGAQVLGEIVSAYRAAGVRIFFCRVPRGRRRRGGGVFGRAAGARGDDVMQLFERAGIVEAAGGAGHFLPSVQEALQMAEMEGLVDGWRDGQVGD